MLLAFELRELDVADSGRSKDEQRCKKRTRKVLNKNFMFIVSSLCSFLCNRVTGEYFAFQQDKCAIKWNLTSALINNWEKKEIYNWQWRSTWERCGRWLLRCAFGDGFAWILKCVDSQCGTLMATLVSRWDCVWTVGIGDGFLSSRRWPRWDSMWLTRCGWDLKDVFEGREEWFMSSRQVNVL